MPSTETDPHTRLVTRVDPEGIWEYVLKNHTQWKNPGVRLLYMTRRQLQEDTSLIIDASDPDALSDFVMKHIATAQHVKGIWIMNMAKMRFIQLPADRPKHFSRFTVTIDAQPSKIEDIYNEISSFEPGKDIMVNYIAQTFQSFKGSIMISVLATGREHMEAFVDDVIRRIEGVRGAELTHISKSVRLVSPEEWNKSVGPFTVAPGGRRIKDIDPAHADTLMASC